MKLFSYFDAIELRLQRIVNSTPLAPSQRGFLDMIRILAAHDDYVVSQPMVGHLEFFIQIQGIFSSCGFKYSELIKKYAKGFVPAKAIEEEEVVYCIVRWSVSQ